MNALAACHRARRAWELSQPQTFMDFGELDGPQPSALRFVEPAAPRAVYPGGCLPGGGLTASGAGPCRDKAPGLTDLRAHRPEDSPVAVPPARSGGSAPLQTTTPRAAQPPKVKRGTGQRR